MEKQIELAWLAGFIDGEGSIGIYREHDRRREENYYIYRPFLQITNTNRDSLERTREIIGSGYIITANHMKISRPECKLAYRYSLNSQQKITEILLKLIPYLVIKKTQAILVADFADSRIGTEYRGWYRPYTVEQKENHRILAALNKRGV